MDSVAISPNKISMDNIVAKTEEGTEYFISVSDSIVSSYTTDLDKLMQTLYKDTVLSDISDDGIERYIFELGNILYFLGDRLEKMGIRDDVSKIAAKEVYNNSYTSALISGEGKVKRTVAELTAIAEEDAKYDNIMNSIYSRAYKQIKYKIDAGYEMLSSLKKILSKRMQEIQLTIMQGNTMKMFNQEEKDGQETF